MVQKDSWGAVVLFPKKWKIQSRTERDNTALIEPGHAYHCYPEKVKHALGLEEVSGRDKEDVVCVE